ncbi:Aminodeoxychorismate lyase [hydrothermal vent metagenome]|uniref:Aminodeoxychorismate lyase n=1 Tax=hydrothermal vent metagenome TaxID=652676 RepID=A0A1W1BZ68_9ZZZZ
MTKNSLLFETIKIENGQIENIEWHNQRCNRSRAELFNAKALLNLETFITPPLRGLYRCRICYKEDIHSIEYIPYTPRVFNKFTIVKSQIDYAYKYNDRKELESLQKLSKDEIIIEKDGLLTDTSIANIAFYNGKEWLTPNKPLLKGTMRAKLLYNNLLIEKDIRKEELENFSHFALMNAMIGFQVQKNFTIDKGKKCQLKT